MVKLKRPPGEELEYTFCPSITTEWAKQLIHDYFNNRAEFPSMRVYFVDGKIPTYRATEITTSMMRYRDWLKHPASSTDWLKTEFVDLKMVHDRINLEVHRIGYGERSNTCFVGILKKGEQP